MNDIKRADPMPGIVWSWEDGDLCPPRLDEIIKRLIKWPPRVGPEPPPRPDWLVRNDQLHLTLAVHQLAALLPDQKAAKQIQQITGKSLQGQLGG